MGVEEGRGEGEHLCRVEGGAVGGESAGNGLLLLACPPGWHWNPEARQPSNRSWLCQHPTSQAGSRLLGAEHLP